MRSHPLGRSQWAPPPSPVQITQMVADFEAGKRHEQQIEEERIQREVAYRRSFSSTGISPEEFAELMGPIQFHHREEGISTDTAGVRIDMLRETGGILECGQKGLHKQIITNPDY
jgi:hypothetical protein